MSDGNRLKEERFVQLMNSEDGREGRLESMMRGRGGARGHNSHGSGPRVKNLGTKPKMGITFKVHPYSDLLPPSRAHVSKLPQTSRTIKDQVFKDMSMSVGTHFRCKP